MAPNRPPSTTEERVNAIRDEIDAFIDARVAEIGKTCPGVPSGVIRNSITRGLGCQCAAYLELKAKDAEAQKGAA
ncbi:hypothetical protein IVB23_00855 [Bradyrhizobium sp. 191]|nr:hypothetical protein IVB23_00855 [Bradyrhizobium sp. 191]